MTVDNPNAFGPMFGQQKRISRCWTCRQRRLKCDGSVPHCQKCWGHGVKCLGYRKPLTWVEGVARRGPMKNRTFGDSQQQYPSSQEHPPQRLALISNQQQHHQREALTPSYASGSVPMTLTEPLFKGLNNTSRFFIDYYHPRNNYRGIITHITSPMVATATVTVAACHYIQSLTGYPLTRLQPPPTDQVLQPNPSQPSSVDLNIFRGAFLDYYLRSKDQCLKLISTALATNHSMMGGNILIAVVLLTILDIFESGCGAWSVHLEGAKKLLDAGIMTGFSDCDNSVRNLLREVAIFQTFGSSLAKPGALTSLSTLPSTWTASSQAVTPIGCPINILSAIEIFASQRRLDFLFAVPMTEILTLEDTLHTILSYDIPSWASSISMLDIAIPYTDLVHLGTVWKLSAAIYACRVLRNLSRTTTLFQPPPVHELMAEYALLEQKDDELMKCLLWPTFIAGAASTSPEHRAWVLKTLDRIWHIGHCVNTRNAAMVLELLWEKRDQKTFRYAQTCDNQDDTEFLRKESVDWDWITELTQMKGSWLFI